MCSRVVSLPEATDQLQLANVKPTVPVCDEDVETHQAAQAILLTHSTKQVTSRVAGLGNNCMSVTDTCDDVQLDVYEEEEIQER